MAAECTGLADIVSALATSQLGCFGVGRWNDGLVLYCVVRCLLLFIMCVLDSRGIACGVEVDDIFRVPSSTYIEAISHACGIPLLAANIAAAVG